MLEAIAAAILAVLAALWYGRRSGAAAEREKQADDARKAKSIADQVDNDVGAIPPDRAREELKRWGESI